MKTLNIKKVLIMLIIFTMIALILITNITYATTFEDINKSDVFVKQQTKNLVWRNLQYDSIDSLSKASNVSVFSIPSESAFATKIATLQGTFKHGEYWNQYNAVGSEGTGKIMCPCGSKSIKLCGIESQDYGCNCLCGIYNAGGTKKYQCNGFAYKMGYECFNIPPDNWIDDNNLGTVYAGDIITYGNNLSKNGHTIFVYKVDGDTIHYADCNATGACQVNWNGKISYSELKKKGIISKRHLSGNTLTGGGKAQTSPAYTYTTDVAGEYYLKNDNTGKYLTVDGFADADKTNISVASYSSEKQKVTITKVDGNSFKIVPAGTSRLVNAWGNNPTSGSNVNLYHYDSSNSSSQLWKFEKVGDMYRIHLAYNENLCLANSGTNVIVQTVTEYSQVRWILEPVHTHNYNTYAYFGISHPHYVYYKCSCGEVQANISETHSYDLCAMCVGRIKYDANGGSYNSSPIVTVNATGTNIPRAENTIVVYTSSSGNKTNTNKYGVEYAFNSSGAYVGKREYESDNPIDIPSGGFVLSIHGGLKEAGKVYGQIISNSKYAYYDYNEKKVYFYASKEDYLLGTKFLTTGNTYGQLPEATREEYSFSGWFTDPVNGEQITSTSIFNGATQLYAHWEKIEDNDFEYEIYNDEVIITKYIGDKSDVIVPSTIEGKTVKNIGYRAFSGCENLTSIKLPNTLTKIGEDAFESCRKLTTINIPESVTEIGSFAFAYCSAIESITIPKNVGKIEDGAFYLAHNLQIINVDIENQYYTSEDGVLFNKDKTKLLAFPYGKSEEGMEYIIPNGVCYIGSYALAHVLFNNIVIPNTVTDIEHDAFQRMF